MVAISVKSLRRNLEADGPPPFVGEGRAGYRMIAASPTESCRGLARPGAGCDNASVRDSLLANVRKIWSGIGSPFALPSTGTADEGTWFELRPEGIRSVGVANPPRWSDKAEAEEAAGRLRARRPDFRYVEIITYEIRNGQRSAATPVGRV